MRLNSINIEGFRGIPNLQLEFPKQVNVLVGVNGVGKSAVLDCTAIMLSRLIGRIRSSAGTGRYFTHSDINNRRQWTRNEIEIVFQGKPLRWSVVKTRRGQQKQSISGLVDLRRDVELFRSKLAEDEAARLPLAVYYPVNRAVLDIPLRIRKRHPSLLRGTHCKGQQPYQHFRPKRKFPELQLDYTNLHCSCQREPSVGEPRHCGYAKGSWFNAELLVSPLAPDCEDRFRFTASGEILPRRDDDAGAKETIRRLRLDLPKLRALRAAAVNVLYNLATTEIRQLLARDTEGRFLDFHSTIEQVLLA